MLLYLGASSVTERMHIKFDDRLIDVKIYLARLVGETRNTIESGEENTEHRRV